ncbi:hypothetical protein ACHAW5_006816 [Stephanodiscus triporus]|uniref:Calmodulin n=1 Tax=Stephanodiscus triporus TaxID=2934178 RepID=A0ABD3PXP7_9STRA
MFDAIGKSKRCHCNERWGRRRVVDVGVGRKKTLMSGLLVATMLRRQASARPPPPATGHRTLRGETLREVGGGASIDLESCLANLKVSDADSDGYLNQDEYLSFVQAAANGTLDANVWGMPITEFYMLPQDYISTYNFLACGSPTFACPTVAGIHTGGMADAIDEASAQGSTFWLELCRQYVRDLASASPTAKPSAVGGGTAATPTRFPAAAGPSSSPSAAVPRTCPTVYEDATAFEAGATYEAGDLVVADDGDGLYSYYECNSYPESLYCGLAMYEPGNSLYWEGSWTLLEQCLANDTIATSLPSTAPSSPPVIMAGGNEHDPPYSGTLVTKFQYEIFNTELLNAESIMTGTNPTNDKMNILVQSTNDFVEDVVATTFGTSGDSGGIVTGNRSRGLAVTLGSNPVSIDLVQDIECSDKTSTPYAQCQKVTASTELTLTDEPKLATESKFQDSVTRALINPGVAFPEDSGIIYVGPALQVAAIPEASSPDNLPSPAPPEVEESDIPGWVVPVSIGVAAVIAVAILFLVSGQMRKRKGNQEHDISELGGSDFGSDGTSEIIVDKQTPVSALAMTPVEYPNVDLESGKQTGTNNANPFLTKKSESSNPFLRGSDSESDSVGSESGSTSSSGSSSESESTSSSGSSTNSNENRADDPESLRFQTEPEALQQGQRLQTLNEVSEDNLSFSMSSLMSENSTAYTADNQRVYRAAIEALVTEACPDKVDMIDDMMIEYDGREEELIRDLSRMLAAKNDLSAGSGNGSEASRTEIRDVGQIETSPHGTIQSNVAAAITEEEASDVDPDDSSTDWSSDDGFSSVDASTVTSDTETNKYMDLAATADVFTETSGYHDSSKPKFDPVDESSSSSSDDAIKKDTILSPSKGGTNQNDLDEAIQAGDWRAVGTTAALIATDEKYEDREDLDSVGQSLTVSQTSFTSHEKNQVEEFEALVEQGNWQAVMAAVSRFETASDLGSLNESRHSMADSLSSHEETETASEVYNDKEELISEIQELVRAIMPDELENLEEMLLTYDGREGDLLETLRTMQQESSNMHEEDVEHDNSSNPPLFNMTQKDGSVSVFESEDNSTKEDSSIPSSASAAHSSEIFA